VGSEKWWAEWQQDPDQSLCLDPIIHLTPHLILFGSNTDDMFPVFHVLKSLLSHIHLCASFAAHTYTHASRQWSHNFRPAYMRLHSVLFDVLKAPRVLALTATATRPCAASICSALAIDPRRGVFRAAVTRTNLQLSVSADSNREHALIQARRVCECVCMCSDANGRLSATKQHAFNHRTNTHSCSSIRDTCAQPPYVLTPHSSPPL
jgi:superfamily II DNA helicase RecQ